jgi:hypothetical protein
MNQNPDKHAPDVRKEVASSQPAIALAGDPGASPANGAPVDTDVRVEDFHIEELAKLWDEGENGWNKQGQNEIARKMHRIAAGVNHFSHDEVLGTVIRAEQGKLVAR